MSSEFVKCARLCLHTRITQIWLHLVCRCIQYQDCGLQRVKQIVEAKKKRQQPTTATEIFQLRNYLPRSQETWHHERWPVLLFSHQKQLEGRLPRSARWLQLFPEDKNCSLNSVNSANFRHSGPFSQSSRPKPTNGGLRFGVWGQVSV